MAEYKNYDNRNAVVLEGMYKGFAVQIDDVKETVRKELQYSSTQSVAVYEQLLKNVKEGMDAILAEIKYVTQQNSSVFEYGEQARADGDKKLAETLERVKQETLAAVDAAKRETLGAVEEAKKSVLEAAQAQAEAAEKAYAEKLDCTVRELTEQAQTKATEMKNEILEAVRAIVIPEPVQPKEVDYDLIAEKVLEAQRAEKEKLEEEARKAEEEAAAEEAESAEEAQSAEQVYAEAEEEEDPAANDEIDYDVLAEKIASILPETDYDAIADKVASVIPEVDYDAIADKVVAALPASNDDAIVDKVVESITPVDYDLIAERVASSVQPVDYKLVAAAVAPVDYDAVAQRVASVIEDEFDVTVSEEGISKIAEAVLKDIDYEEIARRVAELLAGDEAELTRIVQIMEEEPAQNPAEEKAVEEKPAEEVKEEPAEEPAEEADVAEDELAAAEELAEDEESEEPKVVGYIETVDDPSLMIRYKRSFVAKIIQSDDDVKMFYSDLKNALLGYGKVKSQVSWSNDRFTKGRETIAKIGIRGKTLCVYLALNPDEFATTVYHQTYVGDTKMYEKTPMMVKVKSNTALKRAIRLIDTLMEREGAEKKQSKTVDYVKMYKYKSDKKLLDEGLIKTTLIEKKELNF